MRKIFFFLFANLFCSVAFAQKQGMSLAVSPSSSVFQRDARCSERDVSSLTEGYMDSRFVDEDQMKDDLLRMLARFSEYIVKNYQPAVAPNAIGEACGCFKSNSTMQNNEDGVRTNADLSMVAAFLCKYAKGRVELPRNVTWNALEQMAMRTLIFAYSTHKANRLKTCAGNNYWGSTARSDHQWESNLWAMSVAYSAFFQWDKLNQKQKEYIRRLLVAECNYELERTIPTGYKGDTKAEENGWDACVLAASLGLFPEHPLAPKWFDRLRQFAINCYSHISDAENTTIIDPDYDSVTVKELFIGKNLYDDYTLQNHNYFHTSYQNVVIQELGEAALALRLFQRKRFGREKWRTNALMHNNQAVQEQVLNRLALADGELAMPNGNDWSLFLYDQMTSYSTNATFLRNQDALMLENRAYKMMKARQTTTPDGAWLLRPDIGPRRMGVQAHRVMMTWLMHEVNSTADMMPSNFEVFRARQDSAFVFKTQNIVRAYTPHRFTTFSWASGINSYTGYIAAHSFDKNKIFVPYKAHNTGNILGWYKIEKKKTNAKPIVNGIYSLEGTAWTMNGELHTNEETLDHRFAIYSTPGNAVIYIDCVTALRSGTIEKEQGGLTAISTDEFTKLKRTLYYGGQAERQINCLQTDGAGLPTFTTDWINVDNALGIIARNNKQMAFGDRADNNSIMTSKLYPAYDERRRAFQTGETIDRRNVIWYSNITADSTRLLSEAMVVLRDSLPSGWNGVVATDPDGTQYMLISNFNGAVKGVLRNICTAHGAPVFRVPTTIIGHRSTAAFNIEKNHSLSQPVKFYVNGKNLTAVEQNDTLYLQTSKTQRLSIFTLTNGNKKIRLKRGIPVQVYVADGKLVAERSLRSTWRFEVSKK